MNDGPPPAPAPASGSIHPWRLLSSRRAGEYRVFSLRSDRKVSPRNGIEHDFVVIEAKGWVNVIALTPRNEMILIRQFRHGTNTVELEIPGGVMDPGDASPVHTAERELREETGFSGQNARIIGRVSANPAIMNNTCYTVLVEQCEPRHPLALDPTEDLETELVPVRVVPGLVAAGQIRHSLVVAALYHFSLHRPTP